MCLIQMNKGWVALEMAPDGSFKKKFHVWVLLILHSLSVLLNWAIIVLAQMWLISSFFCRLGLWLLSRVKPSEIFLKSISKEVTGVEVIYPSRLVVTLLWMCCLFEVLPFYSYNFSSSIWSFSYLFGYYTCTFC